MQIFGKKKKTDSGEGEDEDEDALIDRLTRNAEKPEKTESKRQGSLDAEIEKLGTQISALREVLQAQQERFERQSEEIGELRSALAEREKHKREIEAKAMKASDLVEEGQPENLMSEQKKTEAKIDAIKAKIESGDAISNSIIEELKKLKGAVSVFRGIEEVIKLNKEIQNELKDAKKVGATVEKHADRVEAIYSSFESNFELFEKIKEEIKNVSDACAPLKKDVEKNAVAIKDIPKKDEFYALKADVRKTLDEIKAEKAVYEKRNASNEDAHEEMLRKVKSVENAAEASSGNAREINEILNILEKMSRIIARMS